nr:putative late blight resistance protein homolog R1A-3 [Ipomoea batatas]
MAYPLEDDPLQCLENIENNEDFTFTAPLRSLKVELRFLKTFFWCMANRSADRNPKSKRFLSVIEGVIVEARNHLHSQYCNSTNAYLEDEADSCCNDILEKINKYKTGVRDFYTSIPPYRSRTNTTSIGDETSADIIQSLIDNMSDLLHHKTNLIASVKEKIKSLEEKLRYLRSFVKFTKASCVEQDKMEDLLTHIHDAVADKAAYLSYQCWVYTIDANGAHGMNLKLTGLLENIKPHKPEVTGIYTDQIDSLHKELRFLIAFFIDPPKQYAQNFTLTRLLVRIEAMIKEAGSTIFHARELHFTLPYLLEKMGKASTEIREVFITFPRSSYTNFPKTDELGFIDSLLHHLKELVYYKIVSDGSLKDQIKIIQQDLVFLRDLLHDSAEQCDELTNLRRNTMQEAYRVEYTLHSLLVGDHTLWSHILDDLIYEIRLIKRKANHIMSHKKTTNIGHPPVARAPSRQNSEASTPKIQDVVVGLEGEVKDLVIRLTSKGQQDVDHVVSIVGMPGLGKTTLAKKVYNNNRITKHFDVQAWCCISQQYDKGEVLLELLSQINAGNCYKRRYLEMGFVLQNCIKLEGKLQKSVKDFHYGDSSLPPYPEDHGIDPHHSPSSCSPVYEHHRLCIYSKRNQLLSARPSGPCARTLLIFARPDWNPQLEYNVSTIFHGFKLLKVLDLGCINMGQSFPSQIELLVQLRYLAVWGSMKEVPSSIENLWKPANVSCERNNEKSCNAHESMGHAEAKTCACASIFCLHKYDQDFLDNNVETLSTLSLRGGKETENLMRIFHRLRKLTCRFSSGRNRCDLHFPLNLKKLTLSKFGLPWAKNLSNSEALGPGSSETTKRGFCRGRVGHDKFLKLDSLDLVRWNAEGHSFPRLQHLVLRNCKKASGDPVWACRQQYVTDDRGGPVHRRSCIFSQANPGGTKGSWK